MPAAAKQYMLVAAKAKMPGSSPALQVPLAAKAVPALILVVYVGIRRKKYIPRKKKIASGAQPESRGGNWPIAPMASNNAAVAQ